MRTYRNYTDNDIVTFSKEVKSIAGLLKKLNLKPAGGNYINIKRLLQSLNVDTNHWGGQSWNKNAKLKDWKDYTRVRHLKKHLIELRTHKCESCLKDIWLETKIPLEVHHIDGNRTNNSIDNLRLLCCNCHALTDTWRKSKMAA